MRLLQHEQGNDDQDAHIGEQFSQVAPIEEAAQLILPDRILPTEPRGLVFPLRHTGGKDQHDPQLGDLRGLIGGSHHQQQLEPAGGAVDVDAQGGEDQNEEHHRHAQDGHRPGTPALVVQSRHQP